MWLCSESEGLAFLQWEGPKGRRMPLFLISLTCNSSEPSRQLTPLHSISNHLTSLKLFKVEMQNPLWDCKEILSSSFELVMFWPSYSPFNSVWLGVRLKFCCFLGEFWLPKTISFGPLNRTQYNIYHVWCFSREDLKAPLQMSTSNC